MMSDNHIWLIILLVQGPQVTAARGRECYFTPNGENYMGTQNMTTKGNRCLVWADVDPQRDETEYGLYFPERSVVEALNYCRNPTRGSIGLFCYVAGENDTIVAEKCDAPMCSEAKENPMSARCLAHGGSCIRLSCCPHKYYVNHHCDQAGEDMVCCLHQPDCDWHQKIQDMRAWPLGTYGLPQTVYGCPHRALFPWVEGKLTVSSENSEPVNSWTEQFHHKGPYSTSTFSLAACYKMEGLLSEKEARKQPPWPQGSYCVYQMGVICPEGFTARLVPISLDQMLMELVDPVPVSFSMGKETSLRLCCRSDGSPHTQVPLPSPEPFMLIKNGPACQQVAYMFVREEIFFLDGHRQTQSNNLELAWGVTTADNTTQFHFCHYEGYETCFSNRDKGASYKGHVSFSPSDDCGVWEMSSPSTNPNFEQSNQYILEKDFCRNPQLWDDSPYCGDSCGIPYCEPQDRAEEAPAWLPVRQMVGTREDALLTRDGDRLTCFLQSSVPKPWLQLDLQRDHIVLGVYILINAWKADATKLCGLRHANIYVGQTPDDFLNEGAPQCLHDVTTNTMFKVYDSRCKQPVQGRYVTIRNLVDTQFDRRPDLFDTFQQCLTMCEVKVYVQETLCSHDLHEQEIDPSMQFNTSSSAQGLGPDGVALYSQPGWCADRADMHPFIKVKLIATYYISSITTQGHSSHDEGMVTHFNLEYGFGEKQLRMYEENIGYPKVFINSKSSHQPINHVLHRPIYARLLIIRILHWKEKACMRLQVTGCSISSGVNLALNKPVKVSSTYSYLTHYSQTHLVDGRPSTCWGSSYEESPWIKVNLGRTNAIHSITLRGDPFVTEYQPCLLPGNKGETYIGNISKTLSGATCQRWDSQSPHGHGMQAKNFPEQNMTLAEDLCRNPDSDLSPWCYTTNPDSRFEFCDVLPCDVMMRVNEARVTTLPAQKLEDQVLCEQVSLPVKFESITFDCPFHTYGQWVTVRHVGEGFLSGCELEILPAPTDVPITKENRDGSQEVTCPSGDNVQLVSLSKTVNATMGTVTVDPRVLSLLGTVCPPGHDACRLPPSLLVTPTNSQNSLSSLSFACGGPDMKGIGKSKCHHEVSASGVVLSTDDYLDQYDSASTCMWTVTAPNGSIAINLTVNHLNLKDSIEAPWQEVGYKVDPGRCQESLSVQYHNPDGSLGDPFRITSKIAAVTPGNTLSFFLKTCQRLNPLFGREYADMEIPWTEFEIFAEGTDCYGCQDNDICKGMRVCSSECGYITSEAFPVAYKPNSFCTWHIKLDPHVYVQLKFLHFDIFEEETLVCSKDWLLVTDVGRDEELGDILGRFCNTQKPATILESSWNQLKIEFNADDEGERTGFMAKYTGIVHSLTEELAWDDGHTDCPAKWLHFDNNCYKVIFQQFPMTWFQAEEACTNDGAHLASVGSHTQAQFLHSLLLANNSDIPVLSAFLGLTDQRSEGVWEWSDGSPVVFTYWVAGQPEGASSENCAMMTASSLRVSPNWQDIPCAYTQVAAHICQQPANLSFQTLQPIALNLQQVSCPEHLFQCNNSECILPAFLCDGKQHCKDGSDENSTICGTDSSCPEFMFTCNDGTCVSNAHVCDTHPNCPDRSDESFCDYPQCSTEQFTCHAGQCIDLSKHCDLQKDCLDGSDETDCVMCNKDTAFQCFNGDCIPKQRLCDGVVDCAGNFHEDEPDDCFTRSASSCLDIRLLGYTQTQSYTIYPDDNDPLEVECDISSFPDKVFTKIHHNSEEKIYVKGYEPQESYIRNVKYFASVKQIEAIRATADYCQQYMKVECYAAEAFNLAHWRDINNTQISYGVNDVRPGCNCILEKACDDGRTICWCTSPPSRGLVIDEGFIRMERHLPLTQLALGDTGSKPEYLFHTLGPFVCVQEYDPTNAKFRCDNGASILPQQVCLHDRDSFGVPLGCRDGSHLQNCANVTCPDDYVKCPSSFCIDVKLICDGAADCPLGEDEQNCGTYECPAMYRCAPSDEKLNCITTDQQCDTNHQPHCSEGDDEWLCGTECPSGCSCNGLAYFCIGLSLTHVPPGVSIQARLIDLSHNSVQISNATDMFLFPFLFHLSLSNNGISVLLKQIFSHLPNLLILDLSSNEIQSLEAGVFEGLKNLKELKIGNNPLSYIAPRTFMGLADLPYLNLSHLKLTGIESHTFKGMISLRKLDISHNYISKLSEFSFIGIEDIEQILLHENEISTYSASDFQTLTNLQFLQSDEFTFCCFVELNLDQCLPGPDELSSCDDLMSNNILRSFLWILGMMALFGNGFVLIWRSVVEKHQTVPSYLVMNLAVSDFLMGIYMVAIASVDAFYRGKYIENSLFWKHSWFCKLLGCLSTISSEASVFILCVITGDRFKNIVLTFNGKPLNLNRARMVMLVVWFLAILLGVIPLFPSSYFSGEFYSRSPVCVSLHITQEETPGWEYSVAVFHGLNFTAFMFLFVAYGYMYNIIRSSTVAGVGNKKREMTAARKMTLIVLTDFCCWIPINIMGVLALSGTSIPGEVYAWTVVFLLPVNSALNPLLYTISTLRMQKDLKDTASSSIITKYSQVTAFSSQHPHGGMRLDSFLAKGNITLALSHDVARNLAVVVKSLHDDQLNIGPFDTNSVLIQEVLNGFDMGITCCPQPTGSDDTPYAADMEQYGRIISRMLTSITRATKAKAI